MALAEVLRYSFYQSLGMRKKAELQYAQVLEWVYRDGIRHAEVLAPLARADARECPAARSPEAARLGWLLRVPWLNVLALGFSTLAMIGCLAEAEPADSDGRAAPVVTLTEPAAGREAVGGSVLLRSSHPETPVASDPKAPAASDPKAPAASDPKAPVASDPKAAAASDPKDPAGSDPKDPAGSDPKAPTGSDPKDPAGSDPKAPASSGSDQEAGPGAGDPAATAPGPTGPDCGPGTTILDCAA
jgi:hypothetical protein